MAGATAARILFALLAVPLTASLAAADGTVIITQAKALQGGVSPNDTPGYPIVLAGGTNYRLGSDLRVPADRSAFSTYGGTIDLGGYTVSGGGVAKYFMGGAIANLTVRNGTVTGFKNGGIVYQSSSRSGKFWTIENVTFTNNGSVALTSGSISGIGFNFRRNVVISNKTGIECGEDCHVEGNIFAHNQGAAITIASGTILGNTIIDNAIGILGSSDGTVSRAVGYGNNTIAGNTKQVKDPASVPDKFIFPLAPNVCKPAC